MADRKRFQFADPDSGAELELSLGLSKATSEQSGRDKKRKNEEQWAGHGSWYGYGAQYMPLGNVFGQPQVMPCWPPATFMPNVFPAPFTQPQTSSESSVSDDQFSSSSIQYTEGSWSTSGSSKNSDARSRQVSMAGSTKGKGENYKERFAGNALTAEQAASFARMPCVLTTGNGPQGRTIVGFLKRYCDKEISIVCVCHGTCFSPAEFVKHAGGADVSYPLRQIVVVPS